MFWKIFFSNKFGIILETTLFIWKAFFMSRQNGILTKWHIDTMTLRQWFCNAIFISKINLFTIKPLNTQTAKASLLNILTIIRLSVVMANVALFSVLAPKKDKNFNFLNFLKFLSFYEVLVKRGPTYKLNLSPML